MSNGGSILMSVEENHLDNNIRYRRELEFFDNFGT